MLFFEVALRVVGARLAEQRQAVQLLLASSVADGQPLLQIREVPERLAVVVGLLLSAVFTAMMASRYLALTYSGDFSVTARRNCFASRSCRGAA
jgi:hypothetical protein